MVLVEVLLLVNVNVLVFVDVLVFVLVFDGVLVFERVGVFVLVVVFVWVAARTYFEGVFVITINGFDKASSAPNNPPLINKTIINITIGNDTLFTLILISSH